MYRTTRTALVLAALLLVAIAVASFSQSQRPSEAGVGRYQLIKGKIPVLLSADKGTVPEDSVLLVDTRDGRVWQYSAATQTPGSARRGNPAFPPYFASVPVDGINGWSFTEAVPRFYRELAKQ